MLPLILLCAITISAAQSNCGPGKFRDGLSCKLCPRGTYQDAVNATSCIKCPKGFFNQYEGAQGIDICKPCPPDTFGNRLGAVSIEQCRRCPSGQTSDGGTSNCISCPEGTIVSSCDPRENSRALGNPTICSACSTGNDIRDGGNVEACFTCFRGRCLAGKRRDLQCRKCPTGEITGPGPNSRECSTCQRPGILILSAEIDTTKCSTCPPGQGTNGEESPSCKTCDFFDINDGRSGECFPCPDGFTGNARRGSTHCVPCPRGTFGKAGSCMNCRSGENSNVTGARACVPDGTPCASNFFRNFRGACQMCTRLERYDPMKQACVTCPPNTDSNGNLDQTCRSCQKGERVYGEGEGNRLGCDCEIGFFRSLSGRCEKCPAGTYGFQRGRCEECSPGFFQPKAGQKKCEVCPSDQVQPRFRQTECVPCPRGLVANVPSQKACVEPTTNCRPTEDRMVNFAGYVICVPRSCPQGFAMSNGGPCIECSISERFDPVQNTCVFCGFGLYSGGGVDTICKKCPNGQGIDQFGVCTCSFGRRIVGGKCKDCPPGTRGRLRSLGCTPCGPGTFSSFPGSEVCQPCRKGTFSGSGARRCEKCPEGSTTFGLGEANCVRPGSLL